jgi:type II secretory pathway pseudopilin PulG
MKKKAAIWVSTVLYILITIAVLGIALAALKPEIDKMGDKAIIEQSIEMMNEIDNTIIQVDENIGTRRQIQIQLKKGKLTFFCPSNEIIWQFNTTYEYSEPEEEINIGNIIAKTTKVTGAYSITLTLDYEDRIDIQFNEEEIEEKTFTAAELPYIFFIENKGDYIDIFPLSS